VCRRKSLQRAANLDDLSRTTHLTTKPTTGRGRKK
jgi:hypothetical protein